MHHIVQHGETGHNSHSYSEFESNFLQICQTHREEGKAMAFAFILYDFTAPQIAKVLRDRDYWNALDQLSGKYLTVFSFHSSPATANLASQQHEGGDVYYNMLAVRVSQREPMDGGKLLKKYFELGKDITLPSVVFFQVTDKGVADAFLVQIQARKVENAFIEIQDIIKTAKSSVSMVLDENRGNAHEIFNLIRRGLDDRNTIQIFKVGFKGLSRLLPLSRLGSL